MSSSIKSEDQSESQGLLSIPQKPTILLHPLALFSFVWLGVVFLYSLRLSKLLLYPTQDVVKTIFVIWAPFAIIVLIFTVFRHVLVAIYPALRKSSPINSGALEQKLVVWFRVWMAVSLIEIIISGGIPLLWLIQGSTKTYRDFGISSLHGLVNSLLLSIGVCRFALFLIMKKRRHLAVPVFILVWSILVVTRNMFLVYLIQAGILFFWLRPVKKKTMVTLITSCVATILVFGAIGDYRSGSSDLIKLWAQPTEEYPDWLPSGVLWAYIYISTPINNLVYTSKVVEPSDNAMFPYTVSTLFPSVIREIIYGSDLGDAESGQLVTSIFNVSTAYIGPFQDYGWGGVAIFSALIAAVCQFYWFRRGLRDVLIFSVLAQCLILTLFFNHFFYLPVISQAIWISYFFKPQRRSHSRIKTRPILPFETLKMRPTSSPL